MKRRKPASPPVAESRPSAAKRLNPQPAKGDVPIDDALESSYAGEWIVRAALQSYSSLEHHIGDMTIEDCEKAFALEQATRRRKALLRRLLQRAVRLNELRYIAKWKAIWMEKGNKAKS